VMRELGAGLSGVSLVHSIIPALCLWAERSSVGVGITRVR
jgi:hypothetical protein